MPKFKTGALVQVRNDYHQTYRGKILAYYAGEIGRVVGITSPNGGSTICYDVCSDHDEPHRPWRDHMWHVNFFEHDLSLVNEEAIAVEVLGDSYFA